jgi:predicted RNA-binding protein with PUA-like domain
MKHWLFKTEPSTFGIDDLERAPRKTSIWDGVRNYQVRNMLRDEMKKGDLGFVYHSSCDVPGIYGVMKIAREGYPEPSALDRKHAYYDLGPRLTRWYSASSGSSVASTRRSRSKPCANMRREGSRTS